MAESADHKELLESSQEEADDKVMMEGPREQPERGEDAAAGPGDDGERGEEAAAGPGEEGEKGEEAAAGSGDGGEKGEDADEDSDPDRPKGLIGYLLDTDFVESLPVKVKYRVLALKKLQTRVANLESKFLREFHGIERKFAEMYQPLLEKRRQIINAIYEPTKEECEYKSDSEDYDDEMYDEEEMCGIEEGLLHDYIDEDDGCEEDYYDYAIEQDDDDDDDDNDDDDTEAAGDENKEEDPKGIPDFWLTVLKNVDTLTPLIKKYDEPILKLLTDIKVKLSDPGEPLSFTLEFHFKPNEYFKNELLTKTYVLKSRLAYYDPHPYRGTAIEYCIGCKIDWNEGKNVTLKTVKKKQKHRIWGTIRTVTEDFPKDSFFNFFTPQGINSKGKDGNDDFLLGHNLRTYIIPRSVLFFSGDALESQQEGVVREVNDEIYDKIIYDNWMAAIEEVKACCKNLEAIVEDIDR
ncbi:nucleosome assembly protein 1-like 2 [Balaenoptera ricei]|uniref:Nucleosome assembly protein 1-like 2 n=1 Tax=Balaenoptera musculus TaxID=9771 RepID=A0A8B8WIU7_BALMU|nr:nucleosome assembly protein 1-like 2 [Balaenoptera musculus]XP_059766518.1 nucleosome assembly protein 1-like 2 [Balaenoptera ricei]